MSQAVQAVMIQNCINTLNHDEGREFFRNALEVQRDECKSIRDFRSAFQISRILRNDRLFKIAYTQWLTLAATAFVAEKGEVNVAELGDGELFKWFLEWFSNGGWKVIVDFIKALIPIFGGLISLAITATIIFLLMC